MKIKTIFLVAIIFGLSFKIFAQDVNVQNNVNTEYGITAVYVNGGNQIIDTQTLGSGGSAVIDYLCPSDNNYVLSTFSFKVTLCSSSITALHTYNSGSTELIEECGECSGNAYSSYGINGQDHYVGIACKD